MVFSSNLMRDLIASLPYRLSTTEPALAQGAAIVGQHNGPFYKITERQNLSRFALRTSQWVRTNYVQILWYGITYYWEVRYQKEKTYPIWENMSFVHPHISTTLARSGKTCRLSCTY